MRWLLLFHRDRFYNYASSYRINMLNCLFSTQPSSISKQVPSRACIHHLQYHKHNQASTIKQAPRHTWHQKSPSLYICTLDLQRHSISSSVLLIHHIICTHTQTTDYHACIWVLRNQSSPAIYGVIDHYRYRRQKDAS